MNHRRKQFLIGLLLVALGVGGFLIDSTFYEAQTIWQGVGLIFILGSGFFLRASVNPQSRVGKFLDRVGK